MESQLLYNKTYTYREYNLEKVFEKVIVENTGNVIASNTIYIDLKKRMGDSIINIPDGYLIVFTFAAEPRLYIIENEISSNDQSWYIVRQLLKFAISYKASGRKIKSLLLEDVIANKDFLSQIEADLKSAVFRNIDDFLANSIFEKPMAAIAVIYNSSDELENVLNQLTLDTNILEFQTFGYGAELIHKFNAFNCKIREVTDGQKNDLTPDALDTLVVAGYVEGFDKEFLGNNHWFAIRRSPSLINRILEKYRPAKPIRYHQVLLISTQDISLFLPTQRSPVWKDNF